MSSPDSAAVVVLTTVPPGFDADQLARTLLDDRLAACVSVLPRMVSTYRWQGRWRGPKSIRS
ncbi:MAG: divalent cation tolerance protein CutA [Vicinamibacterales bacterium]